MSTCWFIGTRWCVATHLALLGPRAAIEMLRYGPLAVRAYAPAADGSRNRGQARNVRSSASCNDVLGVPVVGEKQEAIRRRDWCAPVTNWSNSATTPPSPFGRPISVPGQPNGSAVHETWSASVRGARSGADFEGYATDPLPCRWQPSYVGISARIVGNLTDPYARRPA